MPDRNGLLFKVSGSARRRADLTFCHPLRPIKQAPAVGSACRTRHNAARTIKTQYQATSHQTPGHFTVFRIKICGLRRAEDLPHIAAAGADAVGLNFYAGSKRYLSPDEAAAIAQAVPKGLACVGVFVNATSAEMLAAAERYGLDYLQLHGDEPPAQLVELQARPVIKAFRFGDDGWASIEQYLIDCRRHGALPVAVLVDAPAATGAYGGTGLAADWQALAGWRKHIDLPLILAGGLRPENVTRAIELVRPSGVDTATGVEAANGFKDAGATRSFVASARSALR
jgi:phosphoribosylanthranilate isomerase